MKNNEVFWQNFKVEWPKRNVCFYCKKNGIVLINKLYQLCQLYHGYAIHLIDEDKENCIIEYHAQTQQLCLYNCGLRIEYDSDLIKIKSKDKVLYNGGGR